jgi:hypothetical protein
VSLQVAEPVEPAVQSSSDTPPTGDGVSQSASAATGAPPPAAESTEAGPADGEAQRSPDDSVNGELQSIKARWKEYVKSLKGLGSTGTLDAFLRSACEPVAIEGDVLVLEFTASFQKEKVEDQKYRFIVENQLEKFFGRPFKVSCVLQGQETVKDQSPKGSPLVEAAIRMGARPRT